MMEIILKGSEAETLRGVSQRAMRLDEMPVSCMPLQIEISLAGDFKTSMNEKSILEEQTDQPLEETNEEYYETCENNESKPPKEPERSKTQ